MTVVKTAVQERTPSPKNERLETENNKSEREKNGYAREKNRKRNTPRPS